MHLDTPLDTLTANSQAEIGSDRAVSALGLGGFRNLIGALADAGHPLLCPTKRRSTANSARLCRSCVSSSTAATPMLDLVIPDTGPLMTLALADRLDLQDRFRCPILVTDMVHAELRSN